MKHNGTEWAPLVERVAEIARCTGSFLREERLVFDVGRVEEKNLHDYVSYVDRASERRLVEALTPVLPGAGFLTEEATVAYKEEEYVWIIDPLDGTTNYVHGQPPYAVSIALYGRTEGVLVGVVYDPCREECYTAWKGGGAYLQGKPIAPSAVRTVEGAYLHLGLPYDAVRFGTLSTALLSRFYGRAGGVRIAGSAALDLCGVAAGRVDAYVEPSLHVWDVAAGLLILREAGGRATDFAGHPLLETSEGESVLPSDGYDVVAANVSLHPEFLCQVKACRKVYFGGNIPHNIV
ncbi:MAG: inositol monophosphatase [Porphyromonadaceae bacterium]|nr:inositol monophosphatase [Porphyromonadaceae bacterium]